MEQMNERKVTTKKINLENAPQDIKGKLQFYAKALKEANQDHTLLNSASLDALIRMTTILIKLRKIFLGTEKREYSWEQVYEQQYYPLTKYKWSYMEKLMRVCLFLTEYPRFKYTHSGITWIARNLKRLRTLFEKKPDEERFWKNMGVPLFSFTIDMECKTEPTDEPEKVLEELQEAIQSLPPHGDQMEIDEEEEEEVDPVN